MHRFLYCALALAVSVLIGHAAASRPNIVLILADDMGYSDLGCYGSEISTPNLDRLAANGLLFTQFYNAARCCPTRASLLTGLYPHQAGVGHMLGNLKPPGYSTGLNEQCATIAELLREAGYRNYHIGKWHVGGVGGPKVDARNHPMNRGFDHAYGGGGGGNYFTFGGLYLDREPVKPGENFYVTDAFTDYAVKFVEEHGRDHKDKPFFLHLCYTAPHFPLHAKPEDIAKYRGKYQEGWDQLRERRYAKQKEIGLIDPKWKLSPRDPEAKAWSELSAEEKDNWDLRMAIYAGMIDCMDRGIGRVLEAVNKNGAEQNTLVMFLSDNGSSAEFMDTWPNAGRGNKPGSDPGSKDSHLCLEVAWANASNTPFREHKMWTHEGGIATPFIAQWPAMIKSKGKFALMPSHLIDLMPTCLDVAGAKYPSALQGRQLTPLEGKSLVPIFKGGTSEPRTLAWEHEGNRAIRQGDWKLVAPFRGEWELYNLAQDRTELVNFATKQPAKAKELATLWQQWADRVGVVPWEQLPPSDYKPSATYRKKSERLP